MNFLPPCLACVSSFSDALQLSLPSLPPFALRNFLDSGLDVFLALGFAGILALALFSIIQLRKTEDLPAPAPKFPELDPEDQFFGLRDLQPLKLRTLSPKRSTEKGDSTKGDPMPFNQPMLLKQPQIADIMHLVARRILQNPLIHSPESLSGIDYPAIARRVLVGNANDPQVILLLRKGLQEGAVSCEDILWLPELIDSVPDLCPYPESRPSAICPDQLPSPQIKKLHIRDRQITAR